MKLIYNEESTTITVVVITIIIVVIIIIVQWKPIGLRKRGKPKKRWVWKKYIEEGKSNSRIKIKAVKTDQDL